MGGLCVSNFVYICIMQSEKLIIIDSPEKMIQAIRHYGILPFFKGGIPGWSVEEMTSPDCWFTSSEELGPWDWKIHVVREGDIAYGKFLGGKAAFMTVEYYRHLMNWRRSLPKYLVACGAAEASRAGRAAGAGAGAGTKAGTKAGAAGASKAAGADKTRSGILMRHLSPAALATIRESGSADAKEIRAAVTKAVTPALLRELGPAYKANLQPAVKKSITDTIIQFLEMGTWTVVGDFTRVYRGQNLEYSGWQRTSFTTPDELFAPIETEGDKPGWARFFEGDGFDGDSFGGFSGSSEATDLCGNASEAGLGTTACRLGTTAATESKQDPKTTLEVTCTPEESRAFLINRVLEFYPSADNAKILNKLF